MKKFSEYLKEKFMVDDPVEIINVVADYLEDKAKDTEENEPYATRSIDRLKMAAYEVRNIEYDMMIDGEFRE